MIHKLNTFILRDQPIWNVVEDYIILSNLLKRGGVLFWCRDGEWRAIGGSRLATIVEHLRQHNAIRGAYAIADLIPAALDQVYAYDEWDRAISIPTELVRWLRQEAQELGETDTTAESTAK